MNDNTNLSAIVFYMFTYRCARARGCFIQSMKCETRNNEWIHRNVIQWCTGENHSA